MFAWKSAGGSRTSGQQRIAAIRQGVVHSRDISPDTPQDEGADAQGRDERAKDPRSTTARKIRAV